MKWLFSSIGIILVLFVWHFLVSMQVVSSLFLPYPSDVAKSFFGLIHDNSFLLDIALTLTRIIFGFIMAAIIGVPLGIMMGASSKIYNTFEFLVDFSRSVPPPAVIPLFALFFGIGDLTKIILVASSCALIIAFNTMYGVQHGKALRRTTGRLFGLSNWKLFTKIIFPEALPYIFVGLRVALSSAFIVVIVSEMFIGTKYGLGHRIVDAQSVYDSPTMYVAILLTGLLGYLANKFFVWLEDDVVEWTKK